MDSKHSRGLGFISLMFFERLLQETLLEFTDCVFVVYLIFDHLIDEGFELVFHVRAPTARLSGERRYRRLQDGWPAERPA